ncbi:MAG: GAF domain-containing protein, partial [Anaerolineae bacterium]|nr:GAF domain-containing protein [Anaerolineae bacterium]
MSQESLQHIRELDTALNNARQTLEIVRSQIRSGRVDPVYVEQRLSAVERVLADVAENRKQSSQQERLAKLYAVSQVIGSSLDLQTVLDQVMDAIIQLTGAERGFLVLQDDDGNLKVTVARNFDQETLGKDGIALSRTVTNKVLQTGAPIVTTNAQEDPRFAGQHSIISQSLRSIMATPLRVRGQVIGVVYVDNRVRSGLFNEADLEMLDAFSAQAAVAIDNARLFSATDQALSARVEELTMLQRMDRQLNETLDLEKAMAVTLEWSSKVCHAQSASMGLLDPDGENMRLVTHTGAPDSFSSAESLLTHPLVQQVLDTQAPALDVDPANPAQMVFVAPVQRERRVIGVIALSAAGSNAFRDEARALVARMADRAAIAIENARLYDAVRAANLAKSEFVGVVAHELKVPMTSISGYAELMAIAGTVTERQQGFINTIKNAVQRMKVLVSDLNDISRIETGQLRVDSSAVSVHDSLAVAQEGTITEIERRDHRLVVDVPDDLPRVLADKGRLSQVLLNLLSNAYKYTPDGGEITLRAWQDGDWVAISVTDTGVGMSPEQVAKLGTKFWRADNGLQQPGTGLG